MPLQLADLHGPLEQVFSPCTQRVFLTLLSPAAVCIQHLAYFLYQVAGLPGAQHLQVDCVPALAFYKRIWVPTNSLPRLEAVFFVIPSAAPPPLIMLLPLLWW